MNMQEVESNKWLKAIKIFIALSVILLFQERIFFPELIQKGVYIYHFTAACAIVAYLMMIFKNHRFFEKKKVVFLFYLFLFGLSLTVCSFFSPTFLESLKYLFFVFLGIGFVIVALQVDLSRIIWIKILSLSLTIASLSAILVFIGVRFFSNSFNALPEMNLMNSYFGHFSTAADFTFFMLGILIPYWFINEFHTKDLDTKTMRLLKTAIVLGVIFMLGTTRVSVILCFTFSLFLFLVLNRNSFKMSHFLKAVFFVVLILGILYLIFPEFFLNFFYRFKLRLIERDSDSLAGGFFTENCKQSLAAFMNNPWFGNGFGNVKIELLNQSFSVHGTFFRLLSETGIVGFSGYSILVFHVFRQIIKNILKQDYDTSFLFHFLPFQIGFFLSSIYNIQFFNLEFWIVLTIIQMEINKITACQK